MKNNILAALMVTGASLVAGSAFAGDIAKGEKEFKKCKSCHAIVDDAGNAIVKGGKTGPNLYGVVGRTIASGDFKYSKALVEAGESGTVWTVEGVAAFSENPNNYLKELGISGRSKMSFKMRKNSEDVAAYLASLTQ